VSKTDFKASAQHAERAARSAKAIKKRSGHGTGEAQWISAASPAAY